MHHSIEAIAGLSEDETIVLTFAGVIRNSPSDVYKAREAVICAVQKGIIPSHWHCPSSNACKVKGITRWLDADEDRKLALTLFT